MLYPEAVDLRPDFGDLGTLRIYGPIPLFRVHSVSRLAPLQTEYAGYLVRHIYKSAQPPSEEITI